MVYDWKVRLKKLPRYYYNRWIKRQMTWRDFPNVIQIDTNNHCGYKYCGIHCTYCYPQWKIAKGEWEYKEMPMEWIEWIAKQMAKYGKNMSFVDMFLNGDALAEPRLPEILHVIKKYCPWLYTQTFTCGTLPEKADLLVDKNLDSICFTVSAHTPELYMKIHRGNRFHDVLKTLDYVIENRHKTQKIEIHCVVTKDNYDCLEEWWRFFSTRFPEAVLIFSALVRSYDNLPSIACFGNYTLKDIENRIKQVISNVQPHGIFWDTSNIPAKKPCVLWDNMSISVDGYILQCCNWSPPHDWNYGTVEQYIREGRSLKDAWKEKQANKMRNKLCDSCNMKAPDWRQRLNLEQKN